MATSLTDRFAALPPQKPDVVFQLDAQSKADTHPSTVNLVIGAYRDGNGKPYLLNSVQKAERILLEKKGDKEYLPIDGHAEFAKLSAELLLGKDNKDAPLSRVARAQALSGTGACRIGAEVYAKILPRLTAVFLSDPTWANHQGIFAAAGFTDIRTYRYFDKRTNGFDFAGALADLGAAPEGSIIVLHLCAHNPTGADPTQEQWEKIADVCAARHHYVFFDAAYQGYASGSLDRDAYAARLFARKGLEFFAAQSYAKNMGLYGERVGCFVALCGSAKSAQLMQGMVKSIVRPMYSNPPLHGARIASTILGTPELREEWEAELHSMAQRIISMRTAVFEELKRRGTPGDWSHIVKQIGMFSFTGLKPDHCARLQKEFHVYILGSGRASIAGLTEAKAKYFAEAIDVVVRGAPGASKL